MIFLAVGHALFCAFLTVAAVRAFRKLDPDHKATALILYAGGLSLLWGADIALWYEVFR